MRKDRIVLLLLVAGSHAACHKAASPTTGPTAPTAPVAADGPGATICADLGGLIEAARTNFPDMRRQDHPVTIENNPGFEATVVLPSTVACRILTSEAPYPDAYECDLAPTESAAKAQAVVERWGTVVAACPQLATWAASAPSETGRKWELETGDDHELVVQLFTAGDDHARPTVTVRRNEI
ncbi:MAG: hypothetical protein K8W52_29220 [Deltaproteobacteria bacterium]|nr:hypothetical protein [Deltaproteobacteria bacterium]